MKRTPMIMKATVVCDFCVVWRE